MRENLRFTTLAVISSALIACSDGGSDPHGHVDATGERPDATVDAASPIDRSADDARVSETSMDGAPDAGAVMCSPPCGVGQVCCTDPHGHFPTCQTGAACPDAGGP
jgi:hypothetical protein